MLAVDTDVVVRYLTGDQPEQSARARAIIDNQHTYLTTTVILETEWVLRTVYRFSPNQVGDSLTALAGLPHVQIETPETVARALGWLKAGLDFADALHLSSANNNCEAFLTFDQHFIRTARMAGLVMVREL
ncbi:MAG TPA: type II toxin-antitoxin system VapC family toxin [Rhizomicrobium sp.]